MKKILKHLKSARILKAAFLLLSTLILVQCKTQPKFPQIYPRVPFHQFNVCVEYRLLSHKTLEIEPTGRQFPIEECDKHFCLTPEDQIKVNEWTRDTYKWAGNKCN